MAEGPINPQTEQIGAVKMSQRISVKQDLEPIVARLNRMVGIDPDKNRLWQIVDDATTPSGRNNLATVGMFHLDGAYGGWALYQMSNVNGGVRDVLGIGHVPARELQGAMFAYINGIQDVKHGAVTVA